jgi:hypothetical protein
MVAGSRQASEAMTAAIYARKSTEQNGVADVVRQIFALAADGWGYPRIARALNDAGAPASRGARGAGVRYRLYRSCGCGRLRAVAGMVVTDSGFGSICRSTA